jgi:hypothetical protein
MHLHETKRKNLNNINKNNAERPGFLRREYIILSFLEKLQVQTSLRDLILTVCNLIAMLIYFLFFIFIIFFVISLPFCQSSVVCIVKKQEIQDGRRQHKQKK